MDRSLGRHSVFHAWLAATALLLPACSEVSSPGVKQVTQTRAQRSRERVEPARTVHRSSSGGSGLAGGEHRGPNEVTLAAHLFAPPPVPAAELSSREQLDDPTDRITAGEAGGASLLRRLPDVREPQAVSAQVPAAPAEPAYLIWRLPAIEVDVADADLTVPTPTADEAIWRLPPLDDLEGPLPDDVECPLPDDVEGPLPDDVEGPLPDDIEGPMLDDEELSGGLGEPLPASDVLAEEELLEPGRAGELAGESAAPFTWSPVAVPVPATRADLAPAYRDSGEQVIARRVLQLSQKAEGLASRGAYYAARAEMIRALRTITQALDARQGGTAHSSALARAMRAFLEADDFAPRGSELEANLDLAQIVAGHRTPVMKDVDLSHYAPLTVQQRYLEYAQEQFAEAGGDLLISSYALYGLARIYGVMENARLDQQLLCLPKAVALHQAALLVDAGNVRAANELGVLLARLGQLEDARRVLLHALSIRPEPEIWMNVAVVHQRLGDAAAAREAHQQGVLLMASRPTQGSAPSPAADVIQWVDPQTFSAVRPGPGQ